MTQAHALVECPSKDAERTVFGFGTSVSEAILNSYKAQNNWARKLKVKEEDVKRISTEVK